LSVDIPVLRQTKSGEPEADIAVAALKHPRAAEIPGLTGIRGNLALWVVIYHFWPDVPAFFHACDLFSPVIAKGDFPLTTFYLFSGIVLAHNYRQIGRSPTRAVVIRFLYKRLARIYPVHFVSLMAVLAMVLVSRSRGWSIEGSGYTSWDFVLNLFLVHTWVPHFSLNWNYPSWSISSEWFAYLFFCPLMILCHRLPSRIVGAVFALSIIGTLAIYYSPKETPYRELLCVVPTFAWGAIFVYAWNGKAEADNGGMIATAAHRFAIVPVLLVIATCYVPSPYYTACLLLSLGMLLQSLYLAGARPSRLFDWTPVKYLGEVSYSLYMTHTLAQKVLYQLLPTGQHVESVLPVRLLLLISYIVAIGAATVIMYYLIERPALKFMRPTLSRS
jgi:peptidoglycan/LPS O-acetylase OafA/YrhL